MTQKVLGIYCAGGFGGVTHGLAETLNETGHIWEDILFIEDDPQKACAEKKIVLFDDFKKQYSPEKAEIVIAAGEPRTREILFDKVKKEGYHLPNMIHPWAECRKTVTLGEGNIILAFAYVSASGVTIGNNNIIMPYAQVSHDNRIGSHCVITSSVNLSGTTIMKDRAYIGTGAKLREGITVGADAIVGMGAVVTKSVDDESVVMGMPAKEVRKNTGKVFKKTR